MAIGGASEGSGREVKISEELKVFCSIICARVGGWKKVAACKEEVRKCTERGMCLSEMFVIIIQ